MTKEYDRAYFDRWYRSNRRAVRPDVVRRKVRLALNAAEHLLGREITTVLDVGCGEAPWRGELRRIRKNLEYTGVDASAYVVRRYGRTRNIVHGTLATLDKLPLARSYELVVCSDVLQYVPNDEVKRGLKLLAKRTGGVAFIEAFTSRDDMTGDKEHWHARSARWYRKAMHDAGFASIGLYLFVGRGLRHALNELESC